MENSEFEDNARAIREILDVLDPHDMMTRMAWLVELNSATDSGWFNPTIPYERDVAIASLRAGKRIPNFPRTG